MFGGLFGHGVTSGNHKDFRLAGGAGGNRARQVFVAELTLRGLIGSGQVAVFIDGWTVMKRTLYQSVTNGDAVLPARHPGVVWH
jgi:hypothetical protein